MAPLALRKWGFRVWGCTDGVTVCNCKTCKLDKWECHVFKDTADHEFLYVAEGEV